MATAASKKAERDGTDGAAVAPIQIPRSIQIASSGICTDRQAGEWLSALIGDVMTEVVPTRIAGTCVNAMGKMLKLVEMRHKYGQPEAQGKDLRLIPEPNNCDDARENKRKALLRELAALE